MNRNIKKFLAQIIASLVITLPLLLLGCKTHTTSELQSFMQSIRKELPFHVDSLRYSAKSDFVELRFSSQGYIAAAPDIEIDSEGKAFVFRTFVMEPLNRQTENMIWRNVTVSRKHQRVICTDRYLRQGHTEGFIYVFQTESEKYPTYGTYHWDVSDSRHIEFMGATLDGMHKLAVRRLKGETNTLFVSPESQDDYWVLMFHADSLYADGLYAEARQTFNLAFTHDKYILPIHLSQVAEKMNAIGDETTALNYLTHRLDMEKDFYIEPSECPFPVLKDTFELRQKKWNYDLDKKQYLEWIFERDNYDRMLWFLASSKRTESPERVEKLARRTMDTDSTNLQLVSRILSETGYPRKSKVGDFATLTVWMIIQHSDLGRIKQFLPQLEEAARRGDLDPAYLAATKDRIDIREGRPQKYGTQFNAPLLDASRVNEWRKEVGLPPLDL